jgi:hypothetical protein
MSDRFSCRQMLSGGLTFSCTEAKALFPEDVVALVCLGWMAIGEPLPTAAKAKMAAVLEVNLMFGWSGSNETQFRICYPLSVF